MTVWERIRSTLEMKAQLLRIFTQGCFQSGSALVVLVGGGVIRAQITAKW